MKKFLLFISILSLGMASGYAQDSTSLSSLVNDKNFVFKANTAHPMGGGVRQLTGGYELRMTRDRLKVYLPYFGRAFSAPIDPSKGALDFSSKVFDYEVTERKKGGYDISIKPKDGSDVQQLFLIVSEGGNASLQVTSNNRQPISFNGFVSR